VYLKATGFSRVDFDVKQALQAIIAINPGALVFGMDLPSTRAPAPYLDAEFKLVIDSLGEEMARRVFYQNALRLYRLPETLITH